MRKAFVSVAVAILVVMTMVHYAENFSRYSSNMRVWLPFVYAASLTSLWFGGNQPISNGKFFLNSGYGTFMIIMAFKIGFLPIYAQAWEFNPVMKVLAEVNSKTYIFAHDVMALLLVMLASAAGYLAQKRHA